jgi:hypothetical protein
MARNCLELSRPVSEHGAACHQTGLTIDALFMLRMCELRGKLRSAPRTTILGTVETYARRLQNALVSERLMFRVPGGWLRLTTKGQQLLSAQLCRSSSSLSHVARGECWVHSGNGYILGMCDMRPKCWSSISGAVVDGRFSKLCS